MDDPDRWLEWEHRIVLRRALQKMFCAAMQWSARPHVRVQLDDRAEGLGLDVVTGPWARLVISRPDVMLYPDTLTLYPDWRSELDRSLGSVAMVIVADNLMHPTPSWYRPGKRQPITWVDLHEHLFGLGFRSRDAATVDCFHRRLFLKTPPWTHRAVAGVTLMLDLLAQWRVSPYDARHSAWLFRRLEIA